MNNNRYIISYLLLNVKNIFNYILINQLIQIIIKLKILS